MEFTSYRLTVVRCRYRRLLVFQNVRHLCLSTISISFPPPLFPLSLAPGASLGNASEGYPCAEQEIGLPISVQTSFQGAALAFQASLSNMLLLILAAIITMLYCSGRALRELYSTQSQFCPLFLPLESGIISTFGIAH